MTSMKKNSFTRNTILILLLLCVIVTPFARHHEKEDIQTDTTQAGDISVEESDAVPA